MYSGGYEDYYYQIEFTIPDSDTKYFFTVPNPDVINVKNFEYAYEGKLAFGYYTGEHSLYTEKTTTLKRTKQRTIENVLPWSIAVSVYGYSLRGWCFFS